MRFLQKSETSSVQTLAQLWLALVGNILLYMVNIDGYYMVNNNLVHLVGGIPTPLKNDGVKVNGFRMTTHVWNGK